MANYVNLKAAINAVIKQNGQGEITGEVMNQVLTAMVNSLGSNYQFAGVATPSTNPGTPDQNVFYMATQAGTYTNFSAIVLQAGISILLWNGSWSSETFFTIDPVPTAGSNNFVTSGGVQNELALGAVYDVSAKNPNAGVNNDGKWESLSALLSDATLSTIIPTSVRKGGMSIKFIQSSDNKYVEYLCNSQNFTTDVLSWEKQNLNKEVSLLEKEVSENTYDLHGERKIVHEDLEFGNVQIVSNVVTHYQGTATGRISTKSALYLTKGTKISLSNYTNKYLRVFYYNNSNYTSSDISSGEFTCPLSGSYYTLLVVPQNGSTLTIDAVADIINIVNNSGGIVEEVAGIKNTQEQTSPDTTLSLQGHAAEAKSTGDAIREMANTAKGTSYFSKNLYDYRKAISGYFVNPNASGIVPGESTIDSDGVLVENNSWAYSDFIEVPDNIKILFVYYVQATGQCVCWDANKKFLGSASYENGDGFTKCTLITGTKFVTCNINVSSIQAFMCCTNFYPNSYVPFSQIKSNEIPYTNGYIIPTGTEDNRIADIVKCLNTYGVCHLTKGTYYVSTISMPDGTRLTGEGESTIIRLLDSSTNASAIVTGKGCTIDNLKIIGSDSRQGGGDSIGTRNGVYVTTQSEANEQLVRILNCTFVGFNGAGIKVEQIGHDMLHSVAVDNCKFKFNKIGLWLGYLAEFATVSNCLFEHNYFGMRCDGGNNKICNCGFDGNSRGFTIDGTGLTSSNNGHGSVVGCTFNHNTISGILVKSCLNGFVFSACCVYLNINSSNVDNSIQIVDSAGISFADCLMSALNATISNSQGTLFNGCRFVNTPSTSGAIMINCYKMDGTQLT